MKHNGEAIVVLVALAILALGFAYFLGYLLEFALRGLL